MGFPVEKKLRVRKKERKRKRKRRERKRKKKKWGGRESRGGYRGSREEWTRRLVSMPKDVLSFPQWSVRRKRNSPSLWRSKDRRCFR